MSKIPAVCAAILVVLATSAPALAAPIQTWTVEGTLGNVNDFNILQGATTFSLEVFVDPDTPNLIAGRQGSYAASATLALGTILETFPVEIGVVNSIPSDDGRADTLQIQFPGHNTAPPAGWSNWQFSVIFKDNTDQAFFTGELPASSLTLADFDFTNGSIFIIRQDQPASLFATPVPTALQTPEPTSGLLLLATATLLLTRRRSQ